MATPRKTVPPLGYAEIERALHLLDVGETSRWVASRLQGVDSPAVQEAVRLLRARERAAAQALLEGALLAMAGPASGAGLNWFVPSHEQVRDEQQRPW
jgi:hypothetical protein